MSNSPSLCWGAEESTQIPRQSESWLLTDECSEFDEHEDFGAEPADISTVDVHETLQSLTSSVQELNVRFQAVAALEMVRNEITVINGRLARLEEGAAIRVPIQSLAPEPYELIKPIEAVVQFVDDEYIASFFDANLSTGGDTQVDAISNLRDLMVGTFELLAETKDSDLGPGPRHQKAVLREFVRGR